MSINIKIISPYRRKHRRAILLMLFRAVKEQIRYLTLVKIYHSDEPFSTMINTMIRGTVGNDALSRSTPEQECGYLIRILRTKYGYTQKEFAKLAGVSQAYISMVEHGLKKPDANVLLLVKNTINQKLQSRESSLQTEPKEHSVLQ